MIDFYYWPTPNGWKISIMLEESGLPYRLVPIDISKGDQFKPEFLAVSPNNRIPAIVDHAPVAGDTPLSVFETGAILIYLAEKCGRFYPQDLAGKFGTLQWLMWQVGGLGPTGGQNGHFLLYAPEPFPYAVERYGKEMNRLYGVLDAQLGRTNAFVTGADYTIADMAIFPWIRIYKKQRIDIDAFPNIARWYRELTARPGVRRGIDLGRALRDPPGTPMSESTRMVLYGQTADSVRSGKHRGGGEASD